MMLFKIIGLIIAIIIIAHIIKLIDYIIRDNTKKSLILSMPFRNNSYKQFIAPTFNGKTADNFIVLKCIVPNESDEGGFAWHLHHVQCLLYFAKEVNKIPIIYFNRGYYYSADYGNNWYTYYFRPIVDKVTTDKIIAYGETYGYTLIEGLPLPPSSKPYLYNNTSFQNFLRNRTTDFNWSYQYITPNNYISNKLDQFTETHFTNKYVIGIHYRGTDKYPNHGDNEDLKNNGHMSYHKVIVKVREYINNLTKSQQENVVIFVASDEEPFIETVQLHFPNVVSYDTARSTANTSDISLDSINCKSGDTDKECLKLKKYQDLSIHRGNKQIPPFKKGEDVVMDIWLLSKCHVMFRSQAGNFSSQPGRINKQLIVFETEDKITLA